MAKMAVIALLSHLAKGADLKAAELQSGALTKTQGPNHWKYGSGTAACVYGGPVDCSGFITAIARQVDPSHKRFTSENMEADCVGDISTMPNTVGIFLWRPKIDGVQSGHVGIYTGKNSNGDKYTVEAFDSNDNVARRGNRLASTATKPFTKWGYLDFVQY